MRPDARRRGLILPLLLLNSSLAAQAVVTGVIREEGSGRPLAGAEVVFERLGRRAVADSTGRYLLSGIAFGMRTALIRHIGYHPAEALLQLIGSDTLRVDFTLEPTVVRLDPVEARADPAPGLSPDFAGRRRVGLGHFIGPDEIRNFDNLRLKDLLQRVNGVRIAPAGNSAAQRHAAVSTRYAPMPGQPPCYMAVYLDGMLLYPSRGGSVLVQPPDLGSFGVTDIEAVEVYRSVAETPVEFAEFPRCGTLVLWSRRK